MSTSCMIGFLQTREPNLSGKCIHCQFEGSPAFTGAILNQHYNNVERIEKLLKLGDISVLGDFLEVPKGQRNSHTFENPLPYVTVAYWRDRDSKFNFSENTRWKKNAAKVYKIGKGNRNLVNKWFIDYIYLYDCENKKWLTYRAKYENKVRCFELIEPYYPQLIHTAIEKGYMLRELKGGE